MDPIKTAIQPLKRTFEQCVVFLKVKHFVSRRLQFSSAIPFCAFLGSWRVILHLFRPFMTYGGSYCTATLQLLEENFEIATLNDASVETLGRSRLISYKILILLDIWVSCWWDFYEAFSEGPSPLSLLWLFTNQKCQKENLFITWLQSQLAKCINSSFLLHNLEWICNWRSIPNSSPNWIQLSRFIKQTHPHHCWMHLLQQGSYL